MTAHKAKATAESVNWVSKQGWRVLKIIEKEAEKGEFGYLYKLYPFTYKEAPEFSKEFVEYERTQVKEKFAKYFQKLGFKTKITDTELLISWDIK